MAINFDVADRKRRISARLWNSAARRILLPLFLATSALLIGCAHSNTVSSGLVNTTLATNSVTGSGKLVTREVDLKGFDEIDLHSAFEVSIAPSESYSVAITSDDNVIDLVEATKEGQTLKLGLRPGSYRNTTFRARIGMPELRRLKLSEASSVSLSEFKAEERFECSLSGASKLVGRIQGTEIRIDAAEASSATLGGAASRLTLVASGASRAQLGDLSLGEASARLREASIATLNVQGQLDADLRSASSVYYLGNPTMRNVSAVEASSLKRR